MLTSASPQQTSNQTVANAAQAVVKSVADPNAIYETLKPLWDKSRAACSGERYVKDYDRILDNVRFTNLLIPFSPSMTDEQYRFYRAEAEWPGITSQFSKMLVGGLLRKPPQLTFTKEVPEEAKDWILNQFGRDDSSLVAFLDDALGEEVQTSCAWVFVDYPKIANADDLDQEELAKYKPYPVLQPAESIVNWRVRTNKYGKTQLDRVIVRGLRETYEVNEFHPTYTDVAYVHELNEAGNYQIRVFVKGAEATNVPVVGGQTKPIVEHADATFDLEETIPVLVNGEPLDWIPAWPLDGNIDPVEPLLLPIIDKEVTLYNKMSRRNHLLYGAATYTPIISTDMPDEEFDEIVKQGLGTWIKLQQGDTADVLKPPTESLGDMEKTIAASIEEMAKLGIRMLTPETAQSGVALELRNAAQTAQLGTLNMKVSDTLRQIIVFMVNWRYDLDLSVSDVDFSLSSDFSPTPLGPDWLNLATSWYQQGLIPRSVWLTLLKANDMLPPDYDDEAGQKEINDDDLINSVTAGGLQGTSNFATQIAQDKAKTKAEREQPKKEPKE